MYAEVFGLREEPFSPTPDPTYLVLTPYHREALAALEYGLRERRGFISLIGEVGTGKTTLLYTLLRRISGEVDTAFFAHTTLGFEDLLLEMLRDLGIEVTGGSKRELIATLDKHLHEQADAGRTTALIIDEAQNLSADTLEELRLLSNFETYRHKLLQIVLVGQPELEQTLSLPRVRQLRDRIAVRAVLHPLGARDIGEYVEHRLRVAGYDGRQLFSTGALRELARYSRGIPRRINALCHASLLIAYGKRAGQVSKSMVEAAATELDMRDRPVLRAGQTAAWSPASVAQRIAAAFVVAAMGVIASDAGVGAASQPQPVVVERSVIEPRLPWADDRETDPAFRRDAEVEPADRRPNREAIAARDRGAWHDFVDWLWPMESYEEWMRMHRPRNQSWAENGLSRK